MSSNYKPLSGQYFTHYKSMRELSMFKSCNEVNGPFRPHIKSSVRVYPFSFTYTCKFDEGLFKAKSISVGQELSQWDI